MKTRLLYFILCISVSRVFSWNGDPLHNEAQKIYPITEVQYPVEYYTEQLQLWRDKVKQDPGNAASWLNVYIASRATKILQGEEAVFRLKDIVDSMKRYVPDSYERYYVESWDRGFTEEGFRLALKAYEMEPLRPEVYTHLMTQYELKGISDSVKAFALRWKVNGKYSPGILAWNHNALMSVESGGLMLTWGDNDTYPSWLLQQGFGIRPDVIVANIHLLNSHEEYRQRILKSVGVSSSTSADDWLETLLAESERSVFFGIGVPKSIRSKHQNNLYLSGLAFRYENQKIYNPIPELKKNMEQSFLLDYLTQPFFEDKSQTVLESMNLNYLPAMILLHEHYLDQGDTIAAEKFKFLSQHVAYQAKRLDDVTHFFEEQDPTPKTIHSSLRIGELDKEMVRLETGLYAARTELSNASYENFLIDLLKNRAYELLEICKPNKVDWKELLRKKYPAYSSELIKQSMANALDTGVWSRITTEMLFPDGHPDAANMPVHSLSYEAAKAYCKWITTVYNQSKDPAKRFRKVLFRLPSAEEWEKAAGQEKVVEKRQETIGPIPVEACEINSNGIAGLQENVAEMINTPGFAKGNCWIDSNTSDLKDFEKHNPAIGVRVFMEVIER